MTTNQTGDEWEKAFFDFFIKYLEAMKEGDPRKMEDIYNDFFKYRKQERLKAIDEKILFIEQFKTIKRCFTKDKFLLACNDTIKDLQNQKEKL